VVSRVQAAAAVRADQEAAVAARERDRIRLEEEALERTPSGRAPGLTALPGLAAAFRSTGMPVDLSLTAGIEDLSEIELDPRLGLAVYRVVEEGLENARRHAPASNVRVVIRLDPPELSVLVSDDGPPASTAPGDGRGLIALRERVTGCGGRFSAGPARTEGGIGSGWTIQARLPATFPTTTPPPAEVRPDQTSR